MCEKILEDLRSIYIVYLDAFIKRRKKSIDELYNYLFNEKERYYEEASTIIKLFQIFIKDQTLLFDIYALNEWITKGTGIEYVCGGKLKKELVSKYYDNNILKEFCLYMDKTPQIATDYKVRMKYSYGNKHIFVIYKLKNDTQITDFDEAKRVKNIEKLLFEIDSDQGILHIKCRNYYERIQIKKYFEEYFKVEFKELTTEIFEEYDPVDFKENFFVLDSSKRKEVGNLYITKIVFSNSLLDKSPEITFNTPHKDVWPSVSHAFKMMIIDINSLDDIKDITISVNSRTRTIRTIKLKDGTIIFKIDDKGLGKEELNIINNKFKEKFGIPLNVRVKNKLEKGKIDQIDSILRCTNIDNLDDWDNDILNDLESNEMIKTRKSVRYICKNTACGNVFEDIDNEPDICSDCLGEDFFREEHMILEVNDKKIEQLTKGMLCEALEINNTDIDKSSKYDPYKCFRFLYNKREYNLILTNKIIPRKMIKSIEKKLVPTVIVYYGIDNEQAKLMTPNSIKIIQFAMLFSNKNELNGKNNILKNLFRSLEKMLHYQIVNASKLANEDLSRIDEKPSKINRKYSPTDFEDDIYAILKDLIFNSEKWGANEIGKPLPEGVSTFEYCEQNGSRKNEYRLAFTFDCKLTNQDDGYSLNMNEKRKAIDYVNKFNSTTEIRRFCTNNSELSSHIFISNKFKESQIDEMIKYFEIS